jgi:hypothetical protein
VWWLEARRREQEPDRGSLVRHLAEVFHTFRPLTLNRLSAEVGVRTAAGESVRTTTRQGEEGYLLRGPRVPIRAGSYIVRFEVGSPEGPATSRDPDAIACELDVWSGESETALSRRELRVSEVPLGQLGLFALPCALEQTAFGVEFRVRSTGQMDLTVRLGAELVGLDGQMAFATSGTGGVGGAHLPSDRHWWRAPVRWLRRAGGAALGG